MGAFADFMKSKLAISPGGKPLGATQEAAEPTALRTILGRIHGGVCDVGEASLAGGAMLFRRGVNVFTWLHAADPWGHSDTRLMPVLERLSEQEVRCPRNSSENPSDVLTTAATEQLVTTFSTSREIPATVEHVFAAFSHAECLSRWWGPAGFTNTFSV